VGYQFGDCEADILPGQIGIGVERKNRGKRFIGIWRRWFIVFEKLIDEHVEFFVCRKYDLGRSEQSQQKRKN
jgi:hypothetical protein